MLNTRTLEPYLEHILQQINKKRALLSRTDLRSLFKEIIHRVSDVHLLHFSTDFSRLSFLIHHHAISSKNAWQYHHLRVTLKQEGDASSNLEPAAIKVLINFIHELLGIAPRYHSDELFKQEKTYRKDTIPILKAVALEFKENKLLLSANLQDHQQISLSNHQQNDHVLLALQLLRDKSMLPCDVLLEDVEIQEDHHVQCSFMVLQPNYLIDISSIASCIEYNGIDTEKYVLNKLLPNVSNQAILLGNVVNLLFDQLIFDRELDIKAFIGSLFERFPLALSLLGDHELKQFLEKLRFQYHILKTKYFNTKDAQQLIPEQSYIEPSFISPHYGIQGRLDALIIDESRKSPNQIIELKSGKIFRPNKYGLNHNHYAQTLLYELLTKEALKKYHHQTANYILYSGVSDFPLRYAPATKNMFNDLKSLRNRLIASEYQNLTVAGWISSFRSFYTPDKQQKKGFIKENYEWAKTMLSGLRPFEKDYLLEQLTFLSREQMQNKLGNGLGRFGQSALWNTSYEEKRAHFSILDYLEIEEINMDDDQSNVILKRTDKTNALASFRQGDVVLLYPITSGNGIVQSQVYKCSISSLEPDKVIVKLRTRQKNMNAFAHPYWNIESDYLDNAIHRNMSSLCEFLKSKEKTRDLFLNPQSLLEDLRNSKAHLNIQPDDQLFGTPEQVNIIKSYLQSNQLFVLWGPPGSGKTSIVLHQMVAQTLRNSEQNTLVIAYTNKAVDEICASVTKIDTVSDQLIRIGSEQSTSEEYKPYLLQNRVLKVSRRQALKGMVKNSRIVVGTLASLENNKELFELKRFDRLIVDEASQILDAQLLWLVTKVKHVTLIGDHHQLPAVVTQSDQVPYVSQRLKELGFQAISESLFSRLMLQLKQSDYHTQHMAMLTYQGRMHQDICAFVSESFYHGQLKILPNTITRGQTQREELNWCQEKNEMDPLGTILNHQRFVFIDSQEEESFVHNKSSDKEAEIIVQILKTYASICPELDWNRVGIITPFKAQIATIRKRLSQSFHSWKSIKIDTVERYQGGAKDIIILSLIANSKLSLRLISNVNEDRIDRKLNVALSRAREQVVVVGNQKVLQNETIYQKMIEYAFSTTIDG